jgi:SAM-dependent methyltransferase
MYGSWEEFDYVECVSCGSLQIQKIPEDLSKFYSGEYYSFKTPRPRFGDRVKRFVRNERAKYGLFRRSLLGRLFMRIYGEPGGYEWFRVAGVDFDSRVLDVGCGSGGFLRKMEEAGFRDLTGVDKFVGEEAERDPRVKILRCDVSELEPGFDFILCNHTLEHMNEPLASLKHMHRILKPGRFALIRVPVASNYAWQTYGIDWVQLGAPWHLHLFSEKGMRIVAEHAGFVVKKIVYDSRSVQFWGSEQIRKGIGLMVEASHGQNPSKSIFTKKQIRAFKKKAEALNHAGDGDQACFYLYKETGEEGG